MPKDILTITNHDRNIFQGKYIYPVVSRRAGGLSLGINLNTNNACNWQCIYCEVPNLVRGKPEPIDLKELEKCQHKKVAIIELNRLNDPKALPALKEASKMGFYDRIKYNCMTQELKQTIKKLEAKTAKSN